MNNIKSKIAKSDSKYKNYVKNRINIKNNLQNLIFHNKIKNRLADKANNKQ